MFERFTERARQVVVLAQEEARVNKVRYIGPEHILVGLLREDGGLAAKVLRHLGVEEKKLRDIVSKMSEGSDPPEEVTGQIPMTPRAKVSLELALREALGLGHNYIGTEHILLGLMREKAVGHLEPNKAVDILKRDFQLELGQVRNEVIRMLSGPSAPILKEQSPEAIAEEKADKIKVASKTLRTKMADKEMLETAVLLGRQFPERPAYAIVEAVIALHG